MKSTSLKNKYSLLKSRLRSIEKELTEEQLDFILHPIKKGLYLKACPGSGKTEVVGIKAAYEISKWEENFSGLAVLSFTKNAAKEISERIAKYGGAKALQHPHFIGTIDSWFHGYILHPFGHLSSGFKGRNQDKSFNVVDNKDRYDFLFNFETVISFKPYKSIRVNEFYFECLEPLNIQSQSRTFDIKSISRDNIQELKNNKKKFLKAGLTTYADAEFLCYYLLKNHKNITRNIVKRFPVIFIDECQDLSKNQIEILSILKKEGTVIHFVGDNNQSIYEFKKVYIDKIDQFIASNHLEQKFLTRNFRSNQKIVNVTQNLEKYNTGIVPNPVIGHQTELLSKSCILWEYTDENFTDLPQNFIDYIKNVNEEINMPESKIKISKSGILARGHTTLSEFRSKPNNKLSKVELFVNALNCWANNPKTGKEMEESLQQLGKAISFLAYEGKGNHQHQYCPEHYDRIEWRYELSNIISELKETRFNIYPFKDLTWKEWTANLKSFLENYWKNLKSPVNEWTSVKAKIKSPNGFSTLLVKNTIKLTLKKYTDNIRMTTFHDIKGETLDAVLMVSSKDKKSKGGHYEHWLSEKINEKEFVRFAYVGSSRPKHLLIWAIPKKKVNKHKKKIYDLGFTAE